MALHARVSRSLQTTSPILFLSLSLSVSRSRTHTYTVEKFGASCQFFWTKWYPSIAEKRSRCEFLILTYSQRIRNRINFVQIETSERSLNWKTKFSPSFELNRINGIIDSTVKLKLSFNEILKTPRAQSFNWKTRDSPAWNRGNFKRETNWKKFPKWRETVFLLHENSNWIGIKLKASLTRKEKIQSFWLH